MTSEPSDKLRALFLTALMVMSVFAMTVAISGSAAAAGNATATQGVSIEQGPVEYATNTNGNTHAIQVAFNRSISLSGGSNGVEISVHDRTGAKLSIANSSFSVYDGKTNRNNVLVINPVGQDLVGDATLYVNSSNTDQSFTIRTTSTTVEYGGSDTSAFKGEWIAVLNDTQPVGTGASNNITSNIGTNNTAYEVFSPSATFQFSGNTGPNATVAAENTSVSEFTAGQTASFNFTSSNKGQVLVDIRNLGLSASAAKTSYEVTDGNADVDVTVSTNVANRKVDIALFYANNDSQVAIKRSVSVGGNRKTTQTFSDVSAGADYYIKATDISTGIEATTADISVDAVTGDASFAGDSIFTEERGDVANITVNLDNTKSAQVYIGGTGINYGQAVDVTDNNNDGEVIIQFNTYTGTVSAWNPASRAASNKDTASKTSTFNTANENIGASFPLGSGSYSLNVSVGSSETGVGSLELTSRSTDSATTWVAPKSASTGTVGGISKNAVQQSSTADGDQFILQFQASGIYGFLNTSYRLNASADAQTSKTSITPQSKGLYLDLVQTNPGANQAPKSLNASNVTIVIDKESNTFYTVIKTASGNGFNEVAPGDKYKATLVLNETSPFVRADPETSGIEKETVSTTFTVQRRTASINNLNSSNQLNVNPQMTTVSGTSTVAPGTNLSVRVKGTTQGRPYLLTASQVTVQNDGTWSTQFNFSGRQDTDFDISVREGSTTLTSTSGHVFPPPTASVTFDDQTSNGESVLVASATLSRGGFIAIHRGSASGQIIGTSKFLTAGSKSNVRIALDQPISSDVTLVAMPHLDEDGNNLFNASKDGAYTSGGAAVTDSASIDFQTGGTQVVTRTVVKDTPTPAVQTRTVVQTKTVVRTQQVTRTVVKTATPGQPGFGIAIAVVALLAAALLAVRRRD